MHVDILLLGAGIIVGSYGAAIAFSRRAAAYINKVSIDKYVLSPEMAKYTISYVEAPLSLAVGAALILAAFVQ